MKKERIFTVAGKVYVVFSALCLFIVSVQAWYDPQMVMSLVKVELGNNDALSSVRGVYGGVGFTVFITLIYLAFKDLLKGLMFLSFFWGFYALSRLLTLVTDGRLGEFGSKWLIIESVLFLVALLMLINRRQISITKKSAIHETIR